VQGHCTADSLSLSSPAAAGVHRLSLEGERGTRQGLGRSLPVPVKK
jgi:hypothetical protein